MSLLYYPYIKIDDQWLHDSILYTNQVRNIVPSSDHPTDYRNADLDLLEKDDFYKPLFSQQAFSEHYGQMKLFVDRFIDVIQQPLIQRCILLDHKAGADATFSIYNDKIPYEIRNFLEDRKLVVNDDDYKVYTFKTVANVFMTLLANFLSVTDASPFLLTPSSHGVEHEASVFGTGTTKETAQRLIFENCLPVPKKNVSMKKIVAFKKNSGHEFLAFEQEIRAGIKKLSACTTAEELKETMYDVKADFSIKLAKLRDEYGASKIEVAWKSFSSLWEYQNKSFLSAAAVTGTTSYLIDDPKTGALGGAIVLAGTVYANFNKIQTEKKYKPLSYLYGAELSGLLTRR